MSGVRTIFNRCSLLTLRYQMKLTISQIQNKQMRSCEICNKQKQTVINIELAPINQKKNKMMHNC